MPKTRFRKLTRNTLKEETAPEVVIDDDSHLTISTAEIQENVGF